MKSAALAFLVLVACSTSEPTQLKTLAPACKVMSAECAYIQNHPWKDKEAMQLNRLMYACVAFLASCQNPTPPPNPPPPNAGGSAATGGNSSVPPNSSGGTVATGGNLGTGGATAQTACQSLCSHLAAIGCPTQQATCLSQCALHTSDARFTQNTACEMAATTTTAAQKCGPAACR